MENKHKIGRKYFHIIININLKNLKKTPNDAFTILGQNFAIMSHQTKNNKREGISISSHEYLCFVLFLFFFSFYRMQFYALHIDVITLLLLLPTVRFFFVIFFQIVVYNMKRDQFTIIVLLLYFYV